MGSQTPQNQSQQSCIVTLNQIVLENIERNSSIPIMEEKLQNCASNKQRVKFFNKFFPSTTIFQNIFQNEELNLYCKNSETCKFWREDGNTHYKNRHWKSALRSYNMALCFGEDKTLEIALTYGNRSAVFLESNISQFYSHCLDDIDRALVNGYPTEMTTKLERRKSICLQKIEQVKLAKENSTSEKLNSILQYKENVLFKIHEPNLFLPAATAEIVIGNHPSRGRELMVKTNGILPGTTVIVEDPFAHVMVETLHWDLSHCDNCLLPLLCGIPCSGCVFAMYCSAKCKIEAQAYHRYECPCWKYLRLLETPKHVILTLRIVSKVGANGLNNLFENQNDLKLDSSAPYDGTSYASIYNLIAHSHMGGKIDRFVKLMQSYIILTLLELTNHFIPPVIPKTSDKFRVWFTTLILHHLENIPCNSLSLDVINHEDSKQTPQNLLDFATNIEPEVIRTAKLKQFAAGIYGTISLINHSCRPNVTRLNDPYHYGRMCIVTLTTLKPGDSLFMSYTKSFHDPLEERQQYLLDNYSFHCQCQACSEKWPLLSTLLQNPLPPQFTCPSCNKILKKNGRCRGSCKFAKPPTKLIEEYEQNVSNFFSCYDLVLQNSPIQTIENLIPVLHYFHLHLKEPFGKIYMAEDTLKRALDLIVYFR